MRLFRNKTEIDDQLILLLGGERLKIEPATIRLKADSLEAEVNVTGLNLTSRTFVDIINCTQLSNGSFHQCPFE